MEKELSNTPTVTNTTAILEMVRRTVKEFTIITMVINTMESGLMTRKTDMVNTLTTHLKNCLKDNGKMIKKVDRVNTYITMEIDTLEIF